MELESLYEKMQFSGVEEVVFESEVELEFEGWRSSNISTIQYWGLNGRKPYHEKPITEGSLTLNVSDAIA